MKLVVVTLATAMLALAAASAFAQESFPARPIRYVNPYPPGGGTDLFARILAQKMSESLGVQVLVDNRPGAQGSLGTSQVAKAAPDGYTMILAQSGPFSINPFIYKNVGYDVFRDFAAVSLGSEQPYLVVVHPTVPARSLKELSTVAQRMPGKLSFASSSSVAQLVGELFKLVTKTELLHIPYKGAGPAVIDLLAGNVDLMYSSPPSTTPHVRTGRLRAVAITGPKRSLNLPDVPTSRESGFPEFEVTGWYGVAVPAATPREIVRRLNAEVVRALAMADVRERLGAGGLDASPSTPEEFDALIRRDHQRWGRVVKASGVKAD